MHKVEGLVRQTFKAVHGVVSGKYGTAALEVPHQLCTGTERLHSSASPPPRVHQTESQATLSF